MKAFKIRLVESISFDDSLSAIIKALRESTFSFVVYFLKLKIQHLVIKKNCAHIYGIHIYIST